MSVVVLAPVLDRPHRAQPLSDSLGDAIRLVYLCSPGDKDEIAACLATGRETVIVPFEHGDGDYARKINYGIRHTDEEWVFQGADDLRFHEGWLEAALSTRITRQRGVIGTNDLGNRLVKHGVHSTHSLVNRAYVERGTADEPGKLLHEGYVHNFCDTEMVETARRRGEFIAARRSIVEHLHPNWKKAEMDETYAMGLDRFREDQLLFFKRRPLWRAKRR